MNRRTPRYISTSAFDTAIRKLSEEKKVPKSFSELGVSKEEFSRYLKVERNYKDLKFTMRDMLKDLSLSEVIQLYKEGSQIPEINTIVKEILQEKIIKYLEKTGITEIGKQGISIEEISSLFDLNPDWFKPNVDRLTSEYVFRLDDSTFLSKYKELRDISRKLDLSRTNLGLTARALNMTFRRALPEGRSLEEVWEDYGFEMDILTDLKHRFPGIRMCVEPTYLKNLLSRFNAYFDISYSPNAKVYRNFISDEKIGHYPKVLVMMYAYQSEKLLHGTDGLLSVKDYLDLFEFIYNLPDADSLADEYYDLLTESPQLTWYRDHLNYLSKYLNEAPDRDISGMRLAVFVPVLYATREITKGRKPKKRAEVPKLNQLKTIH